MCYLEIKRSTKEAQWMKESKIIAFGDWEMEESVDSGLLFFTISHTELLDSKTRPSVTLI